MKFTCTECGKEVDWVATIDEETFLCEECFANSDYFECDECGEYWKYGAVECYNLVDGRCLCEYCAEELMNNDELSEDEIDTVD